MQRYAGRQVALGRFDLDAGHGRWAEVNAIEDDRYVIAFPGTSVEILQEGCRPLVATPNHIVLYRPGARYRRAVIDPVGDHCTYLELAPQLVSEIADGRPLPPWGTISAGELLGQRLLLRRGSPVDDPLETEELLLALASGLIDRALATAGRPLRRSTPAGDAATDAARLLAERPADRIGLTDLALRVHCSPFHLARSFRALTGYTLHGYRTQLRLRIALDGLADSPDLGRLALDLGFCGQSHFTNAFRAAFGIPPGQAARRLRAGGAAEMRNFLQDLGAAAP